MTTNSGHLERQRAEDRLRGCLDAMQRSTKRVGVAVVELNIVSGVHTRPDADRGADNKRHGLGFGFADGLRRRSIIAALVKELVCLCASEHKHTYVLQLVMSGQVQARSLPGGPRAAAHPTASKACATDRYSFQNSSSSKRNRRSKASSSQRCGTCFPRDCSASDP